MPLGSESRDCSFVVEGMQSLEYFSSVLLPVLFLFYLLGSSLSTRIYEGIWYNTFSNITMRIIIIKKRSREMQTLRDGCSKAEPKTFVPPQTPFAGARDGQNLTSWRWSLPSPTNPVWLRSLHAISSYHGNRPTHTQTNPQIGPITIHCAAKLSVQCNNNNNNVTSIIWHF